jgi:hypothetical protein
MPKVDFEIANACKETTSGALECDKHDKTVLQQACKPMVNDHLTQTYIEKI